MQDIPLDFIIAATTDSKKQMYWFKWILYKEVKNSDNETEKLFELSKNGIKLPDNTIQKREFGTLSNMYYELKRNYEVI